MSDYLKLACEAAKKAGDLQIEKLGEVRKIEYKGEINLVTEVDKACEKLIIDQISSQFPDHDILAEEGGGQRKDSDYKWIIDPLDGTTNYAHAYPLFCVSIGLEYKGEIVAAAVYEPNLKEMFLAEKNGGSECNGRKIQVSDTSKLIQSLLVTGFSYNFKETRKNNFNHFKEMMTVSQAVRRDGVAAIDLCYVACGRYDGFWELNLFPWDVAAGSLILKEAGGQISDFSGDTFSVYGKEILATNKKIHKEMVEHLQSKTRSGKKMSLKMPAFKKAK